MTHRPIRFRTRLVALGSVAALALVACGDDDDDAAGGTIDSVTDTSGPAVTEPEPPPVTEPEPVDTESATTAPSTTEPPPEPPATDDSAVPETDPPTTDAPPTAAPPAGGDDADASPTTVVEGSDCLVGDWVITNEEMNAFYDAVVAAIGTPGFEIDVTTGSVGLLMTADTYEYSTDFTIDVQVAGTGGTGKATGSVSGTWSAEAGIITSVTGSSDLDIVIDVGGVTTSGSDFGNGLLTDDPMNMAPFDCAGPTIGFETGADTPRHPVTLTPA